MIGLTKERIVRHFDTTVHHWKNLYDIKSRWDSYNDKQYRLNYVASMVPSKSGDALDVGSGAGQFLIYLDRLGYRVTGLDISQMMVRESLDRLRNQKTKYASVLLGDCENTPFPDNCFDLYTAMGVIEYLDTDDLMIKECSRILKPGGIGIITARNRLCPAVRWKFFFEDRVKRFAAQIVSPLRNGRMPHQRVPISREHSPKELQNAICRQGFIILEQRFCHFYIFPHPLSQYFKPIEFFLAKQLEVLSSTPFGILGSTYIVKFQKPK